MADYYVKGYKPPAGVKDKRGVMLWQAYSYGDVLYAFGVIDKDGAGMSRRGEYAPKRSSEKSEERTTGCPTGNAEKTHAALGERKWASGGCSRGRSMALTTILHLRAFIG